MISFFGLVKALLLIGTITVFYKYCILLWWKIYYYKKQGVTIFPGAWRPLIGNLPELALYDKYREAEEPLPIVFKWVLHHFLANDDDNGFKVENHKAILLNFFGKLVIIIPDKDIAHDIFYTKNKYFDKGSDWEGVFEDLAPTAFVYAKGDESWKAKRKASAHAFAKGRLAKMIEMMKDQLMVRIDKWLEEIKSSEDGKTIIDINKEFGEIICQNILTINFGEDISQTLVDIDMR